jgi:uncharacterized protein involved in exopolysaccharide biosynthesis/Mrp family chromosome partitioning ATPase
MELGFIAQAVRRYLWLVVLMSMMGLAAGSLVGSRGGVAYESEGLLRVEPPAGTNPDRYVATQLVRLTSAGVTETVAALPAVQMEPRDVRDTLTLTQIVGTDVVRVTARADSPERAQAIAQGYIDTFLAVLEDDLENALEPERAQLRSALSALETQLADVDREVEALTAPFLADRTVALPTLDQLNPALATRRTALTQEYQRLLTALSDFDRTANDEVTSRMVEAPAIPTEPAVTRQPLYLAAGAMFGLLMGVALASVVARMSPLVANRAEAEEILGAPFVGGLARRRSLAAPLDQIVFGPALNEDAVRQLCVRAHAHVYEGAPLRVLVTGARHVSGTSTVAALVAQHFAYQGHGVLIVDADVNTPDLSREVGALDMTPVDQLMASAKRSSGARRHRGDGIAVAGFPHAGEGRPHLASVSALVAGATARADVVVIDGGPLMSAASTVQLTRECDVVILTVPVPRQVAHDLRVVHDQLADSGRPTLAVATPSLRKRRTSSPATAPARKDDYVLTEDEPAGVAL